MSLIGIGAIQAASVGSIGISSSRFSSSCTGCMTICAKIFSYAMCSMTSVRSVV